MRLREPYARKDVCGKFGLWLTDKLDEYNMTQTELGDLVHVSQSTISNWRTGYSKPVYVFVMVLCMIFNDDCNKVWEFVEKDWA